jgi:hypothetical protein
MTIQPDIAKMKNMNTNVQTIPIKEKQHDEHN